MNQTAVSGLILPVRKRVLELLREPYAGSKKFKYNHPQARYSSTCHGAIAHVLDLQKQLVVGINHPMEISASYMNKLIEDNFLPSEEFGIGDVVGFYMVDDNIEDLLHTALLIGEDGKTFQQSGTGGIFELSTIKSKKAILGGADPGVIKVTSYRLK